MPSSDPTDPTDSSDPTDPTDSRDPTGSAVPSGGGDPSTEHLTFERRGATAVVTMNRPEAKNALSPARCWSAWLDAWMEIDGNDDIRCGDPHRRRRHLLCRHGPEVDVRAGQRARSGSGWPRTPTSTGRRCSATTRCSKPLIAAVEGWAVAGGTEILQATDIRVAGESAKFGVFEARRGLFPSGGSTVRLRRQIPFTVAMDLLLTAREVSAEEAEEIGLIGRVVPDGTALETALEIAEVIGANGPLAVEAIKASVKATEGIPEEEAPGAIELEIGWPIFATEDAKEGQQAFAEKRPPTTNAGDRSLRSASLVGDRLRPATWPAALRRLADPCVWPPILDDGAGVCRRRRGPRRSTTSSGRPAPGRGERLDARCRHPAAGLLPDQPDHRAWPTRSPRRPRCGSSRPRAGAARSGGRPRSATPTRDRRRCVHGGVIAELFDEVLGAANIVADHGAMTGTLTVRYRKPTPLLADLDARGPPGRRDGPQGPRLGRRSTTATSSPPRPRGSSSRSAGRMLDIAESNAEAPTRHARAIRAEVTRASLDVAPARRSSRRGELDRPPLDQMPFSRPSQ